MKHTNPAPPKTAVRFLHWFCPPALLESVEGDLLEQFDNDVLIAGHKAARRRFAWNVLKFFRPEILLRHRFSLTLISTMMISNYYKVALRNISRRKLYSFINTFGLGIAIAFCILIFLYIRDERLFDQFHAAKDDILVLTEDSFDNEAFKSGSENVYRPSVYLPAKLSDVLQAEVPEVMHVTRWNEGSGIMTFNDVILKQSSNYIDSGFFDIFSFEIIAGSVHQIFRNGNEAVITPKVATRFFGTDDPIGKTFTYENGEKKSFTVVAVIQAPPANSSIDFEMLLPISQRPFFARSFENWGSFSYPTFVRLREGAGIAAFEEKLAAVTQKHLGERFERWRERYQVPKEYAVVKIGAIPFTDLHLTPSLQWAKGSDPLYSVVLGAIAGLILLIAAINYVSLALTTSAARRVEVGIRKVVGARQSQIVSQFGFEAIVLAFISMIAGMGMAILFLPSFNDFTGKGITLDSANLWTFLAASVCISVCVGVVAGSYPSFFLSRFSPSSVLKGSFTSRLRPGFAKPLVVLQFALSAFLIISAVIMYRQMQYISTKDLGYDKEQVLVLPLNMGWDRINNTAVEKVRARLSQESFVTGVAGTNNPFNYGWSRYGYQIKGENRSAYVYSVDPEYAEVLGLQIIQGRNFDSRRPTDTAAVIVNEALVRDMGWKEPLEEYLNWAEDSASLGAKVIGVVKDYHFLSLESEIEPMFLTMDTERSGALTTVLIRIGKTDIPRSIERIRHHWNELFPDRPFEYTFLDEDVRRQYERHERWMKIAGFAMVFAIVIASLGLFGLAGVNALNRTKEIGIRKVMGAGMFSIFVLLNRQYIWLSLIAFAIATPLSWYVMNKWMDTFRFRIEIGWELFVLTTLFGIAIALITVSYHAVRSATINPAETLKYE